MIMPLCHMDLVTASPITLPLRPLSVSAMHGSMCIPVAFLRAT
jgi:hypothetical protein